MVDTKIIAGFSGIGKSVFYNKMFEENDRLYILDADSSGFSKHPNFPHNYIGYIVDNIGKADYILISTHKVVREELEKIGIKYTLVYPSIELKEEYIRRYEERASEGLFINFMDENWNTFIEDIETETYPELVKLKSGEFLMDVLE